jgi:MoxR-like ATPase
MSIHNFSIAFGDYDKNAGRYYLPENSPLKSTIFLALKLGKPLLITGEPGTGKTQLAHWAAWYLSNQQHENIFPFIDKPFSFHTKTSSIGKDLFYQYDAISHFQDREGKKHISEFINLSAMGLSICQTLGSNELNENSALKGIRNMDQLQPSPASSVLLIDEVDKAPREFANDLLDEIENSKFSIKEMDTTILRNTDRRARILVILTSNNENALPEAFLRRCLFYHVPFPSDEELLEIIFSRIDPFLAETSSNAAHHFKYRYQKVLELFRIIRGKSIIKPPSTSELLDWVKVLHMEDLMVEGIDVLKTESLTANQRKSLKLSLYTLIKNAQDLQQVEDFLQLNK